MTTAIDLDSARSKARGTRGEEPESMRSAWHEIESLRELVVQMADEIERLRKIALPYGSTREELSCSDRDGNCCLVGCSRHPDAEAT